jgi:hypothetical protein
MSELQNMRDDAPDQVLAVESSIGQVEDQIVDLTRQIDAVREELCEADTTALLSYLVDVKYPELQLLYGGGPFTTITYGNFGTIGYGTGNISQWIIRDSTGDDVYAYNGINWDDDTSVTTFITDYAFGNDYLTRPLTTGATYGLIPSRANLYVALGILENNRDKLANSIDVFDRYID